MQHQIHYICFIYIFTVKAIFRLLVKETYKGTMLLWFNVQNDNKISQVTG